MWCLAIWLAELKFLTNQNSVKKYYAGIFSIGSGPGLVDSNEAVDEADYATQQKRFVFRQLVQI